jgi:hypothetical protein
MKTKGNVFVKLDVKVDQNDFQNTTTRINKQEQTVGHQRDDQQVLREPMVFTIGYKQISLFHSTNVEFSSEHRGDLTPAHGCYEQVDRTEARTLN